jgi:cytochrome c biogenesis protein CcmG, thiol:disulfide interchange protein DsbE
LNFKKIASILFNLAIAVFILKLGVDRYKIMETQDSVISRVIQPAGLLSLDGAEASLDKKPAVVIFWASWCGPCTVELARIRDSISSGELSPEGIVAIGIWDDMPAIKAAASERQYNFEVLVDSMGEAAQLFKIQATPTKAYIGSAGEVVEFSNGLGVFTISSIKDHLNNES